MNGPRRQERPSAFDLPTGSKPRGHPRASAVRTHRSWTPAISDRIGALSGRRFQICRTRATCTPPDVRLAKSCRAHRSRRGVDITSPASVRSLGGSSHKSPHPGAGEKMKRRPSRDQSVAIRRTQLRQLRAPWDSIGRSTATAGSAPLVQINNARSIASERPGGCHLATTTPTRLVTPPPESTRDLLPRARSVIQMSTALVFRSTSDAARCVSSGTAGNPCSRLPAVPSRSRADYRVDQSTIRRPFCAIGGGVCDDTGQERPKTRRLMKEVLRPTCSAMKNGCPFSSRRSRPQMLGRGVLFPSTNNTYPGSAYTALVRTRSRSFFVLPSSDPR